MFRNEDVSSLGNSSAPRDRRRTPKVHAPERKESSIAITLFSMLPQVKISSDRSFRGIRFNVLDPILFGKNLPASSFAISLDKWNHYAFPLVLAMFSYEAEGERVFKRPQILADLLLSCQDNSPLAMCCEALGIAYLANKFDLDGANTARGQAQGRALAATNVLVGNPDLCKQDETSLCVWLLSLCEVCD